MVQFNQKVSFVEMFLITDSVFLLVIQQEFRFSASSDFLFHHGLVVVGYMFLGIYTKLLKELKGHITLKSNVEWH